MSGPAAAEHLERLTGKRPAPRVATRAHLSFDGRPIDDALVLLFPAPNSFTGESVAEFHTHGSPAVLTALTRALSDLGARPAGPGAFTRRAFENGKMDLTAVEGLADLLEAETEGQRLQALRLQSGDLAKATAGWIADLTGALAHLEAAIDFSDEGDVAEAGDLLGRAARPVASALQAMDAALAGAVKGERMRDGLRVVVAGPPNAGKSTLLNALARRDVAIVTDRPGTTRDTLDVPLDLGGVPVLLTDTAGLRATEDAVERIGIARAEARLAEADLVLWLSENADAPPSTAATVWTVATKIDRVDRIDAPARHRISALTGEGLSSLVEALSAFAAEAAGTGEPALVTRERQRLAIDDAHAALTRAQAAADAELAAEDLRAALHALHRLTGRFDVESVLDALFTSFCIGK